GGSNFNINHGTIRLMVRGNVWNDAKTRYFFEARGDYQLGLRRQPGKLSLVLRTGRMDDTIISRLDLPLPGKMDASRWYGLAASWDRRTGTAMVALDGNGVTGKVTFPDKQSPTLVFYIAGGHSAKYGDGINKAGLAVDELAVYTVPYTVLEEKVPPLTDDQAKLLVDAEAALRKCYDRTVDLQQWGGWATLYTYPTFFRAPAQGRWFVKTDDYISNDKGHTTPRIAARLLYAYEVLGDSRYLEAAIRTGEFYVAAQDDEGFWMPGYHMTVKGIKPVGNRTHVKLQDSNQTHPMFFLAYLHRVTGDTRYMTALKKAGRFILKAQNPNGSWSHHYNAEKGVGENARGQVGGGELNDWAMLDGINSMILMYHLTGEADYVKAIRRAGQWLIDSKLEGKVVGWADQYDGDNNPAWARNFEPPAWSAGGVIWAAEALVEVYRVSGDKRYLEPIEQTLAWMKKTFPDGVNYQYYDPKTGRPIAAWQNKVYFLDDKEAMAFLKGEPIGSGYITPRNTTKKLQAMLAGAEAPKPEEWTPTMTREVARDRINKLAGKARFAIESQHESGFWVQDVVAKFPASLGQGFGMWSPRSVFMTRYIEACREALGEIDPAWRGEGQIFKVAWPKADWYDVDWQKHAAK
ncbi:MAG: pectate lyase, partial [Planctomycetota bacterium]